jgi:anaerobic selenocysteine-containing dehydrogenase
LTGPQISHSLNTTVRGELALRVEKSFCRLCFGFCAMDVTIGDDGRVQSVRGDHSNPVTQGYACVKGLDAPAGMYGESRILRPMKRVGDTHVPIDLEQALDEIAEQMRAIVAEDSAQSLAFFRGTGTFGSNVAIFSWPNLAEALEAQRFSTMTIDQSAKWVTMDRLGTWPAGKHDFETADVWMFVGSNPLVSVFSWSTPAQNPAKALKSARARGTKIIVIDPRKCETANFADIHLQIYPGEDAAVAAGLINIILSNGWEDRTFCAQHVEGLDRLREAVAPFTIDLVARRAGIAAEDLARAAALFARDSRRGSVGTGTGVNMARFPNLAEHLYETIGVICGRFLKEGDRVPNPGVLVAKTSVLAEAKSPARSFEKMPRSRVRGAVRLMGESATPTLAEDILAAGPGRIRAVLISGANPLGAIPDTDKVLEAFRALDLLVVIEPFWTATAKLADYVLPPKILYEHADLTFGLEMSNLSIPYTYYTPSIVDPPAGSDLCDEGYIAWGLAKRMGVTLTYFGVDMDMEKAPTDEDFLRILARNGRVPFDELKREAREGKVFDFPPLYLEPAGEGAGRFEVMPDDVAAELRSFLALTSTAEEVRDGNGFDFRLISRRMREVSNTSCRDFPSARARTPYNPLGIHPDDLTRLGMADGDRAEVISDNARIPAIVRADVTLKPGVVSMTHGFGGMPGEPEDYLKHGANIAPLISLSRDCEPLQAMPRMSGIPVRIEPLG